MRKHRVFNLIGIIVGLLLLSKAYAVDERFSSHPLIKADCNNALLSHSPEKVFFNMPAVYLPLLFTLPTRYTEIPDNPVSKKSDFTTHFAIQCKNNGAYSVVPLSHNEIISRFGNLIGQYSDFIFFAMRDPQIKATTPLLKLVQMLKEAGVKENPSQKARIEKIALELIAEIESPRLDYNNKAGAQIEIEGVWFGSKYYSFEEAKVVAVAEFQKTLKQLRSLSPVDKGDYLYRAPNISEWQHILKNGIFTVITETNFEHEIGSQVSHYATETGYAGVVIRIAVPGPFYRNAGMAVPRITSVLPHYANVEVLEGRNWIPLEQWKKVHQ